MASHAMRRQGMVDGLPGPTPEGQLIRRVRGLTIPKLSIRNAAARIGMSAEQWGYAERGYLPSRGGKPPQPFSPPAATLARMAYALKITPERLESEGQRPDAAEILREMERQAPAVTMPRTAPPPASVDDSDDDIADVRLLLEGIDRSGIPARPEFDRIMGIVRNFPPGVAIPGVVLFDDVPYQRKWDEMIGQEYSPGQMYTPSRMALVIAVQQYRDQRRAEQRGDAAAG